jgi:nucleotide-binding universal stress UspA family protein
MSTTLLFVALAGWLGIGLVLASVLGRRGHDRFSWFVLGALLGPLAVAFAIYAWRHEEEAEPRTVAAAPPVATTVTFRDDSVDVLLGFDGSPGSHAAIASVIGLFGARLRRLTLMTVIPFDGGAVIERQARTALQQEAERLAWLAPEIEVVRGEPARTLAAAATSGGFDLLGVGTAGGGRPRLSGSATRHLTGQSRVPVLVTGPAAAS